MAVELNYTNLRDLLAAKKWEGADRETGKVMCQVAGKISKSWLELEDIDNFPCEDLATINQLWLHYSEGKFGFSFQKEIYESLGGTREYDYEVWKKFADRVGWKKGEKWLYYSDHTFNLELAPDAHLPTVVEWMMRGGWQRWGGDVGFEDFNFGVHYHFLFSRAKTCKL